MFDSYSVNNRWHVLNFVYERTHKDGVIFDPTNKRSRQMADTCEKSPDDEDPYFI